MTDELEPPPGRFDDDDFEQSEPSSDVHLKAVDIKTRKPISNPALASLGSILLPALARAERRRSGKERPVPVPFPQYAEALRGGFWAGVHTVIAGTGAGKSTFMFQVATYAAKKGTPVLYIGLELGEFQVALRAIGDASGVRWSGMYTGQVSEADLGKASEAIPALMDLPFYVEFNTEQGWSPSNMARRAKRIREDHPEGTMLIVLDFLQLVGADAEDGGRRTPELRERIARASYAAVHVANTYNAAVVLISGTARNNYGKLGSEADLSNFVTREVPGLFKRHRAIKNADALIGMGKESGEIEYAAESQTVLVRWPSRLESGESIVLCAVAKLRYGLATWVPMSFWHDYRELPFESAEELPGADQIAKPGRPAISGEEREEAIRGLLRSGAEYSSKNKLLNELGGNRKAASDAFERLVMSQEILTDGPRLVLRPITEWDKL